MTAIRDARPEDVLALTALAVRSKAVWGYDATFMAACLPELTVDAGVLDREAVRIAETGAGIAGFYRLVVRGEVGEVEALFIEPGALRQGIGRTLWHDLEAQARREGVRRLEVDSDPSAEPFYLAMGLVRHGAAPSGSIPGRMLPHLVKALTPASVVELG